MRIGNVIRDPEGSLWVVSRINETYREHPGIVEAVAFDSENVSAVQRLDDHERNETCHCGDHPDFMGEPQEDCETCHGSGRYNRKIVGWKHSKVLANHVQEFIMKGVKKSFGL